MSTWSIAKPATGTPGTAGATNVVLSVKTKCSTPVVCAAGTTACGYETFIDLSPYTAVPTAPVTAATTCCKAAEFCFAAEQPRHPAAAGSTGIRADSFSCVSDVVCAAGTTACGKAHDGSGPLTRCCAANQICSSNASVTDKTPQDDGCYNKPCAQQSATFCPPHTQCVDDMLNDGKGPAVSWCETING
jgi:hypothetical protein